jgi:hypothetical protein
MMEKFLIRSLSTSLLLRAGRGPPAEARISAIPGAGATAACENTFSNVPHAAKNLLFFRFVVKPLPTFGTQEAEMRFGTLAALLGIALAAAGCADLADPIDYVLGDALLGLGDDCTGGELICEPGLVCAANGTCQTDGSDGTSEEGEECFSDAYCMWGLVCAADGTCQQPGGDGTGQAGDDCDDAMDCVFGLQCVDGECYGFQIPYWPGADCRDKAEYEDEAFRAFFDLYGNEGDFYALPFPNDIRRQGGHIDVSGHPSPGAIIPELGDPVADYFDMLEEDIDGFGTNSCTYFRFTRPIGSGTAVNQENVLLVDITPTSEKYGDLMPTSFGGDRKRTRYLCWNWYYICPTQGRSLKPNTTYAAIFLDSVEDEDGNNVNRDPGFDDMIAPNPPIDDSLADAYDAYAPLRDYLNDDSIDKLATADNIAVATVFTTQTSIYEVIPNLRAAVRAEDEPGVTGLADSAAGAYTLYQGEISIPFFQDGERPFRTTADGGAITYDSGGTPIPVEEENVKFALSVPTGTAPIDGWPIMIFAHGTGGSELSFTLPNGTEDSVADRATALGVAVIGIEQVQHGDRRGLSADEADLEANSPERLFYNFLNPRAARDNNVQAAADHFQVVRLIEGFSAITGESVSFDADSIIFFGHSQGSQGPALFAAHEPAITLVVLSGAGGNLINAFVEKKNPVDIAAAAKIILADPEVKTTHPLLNLIQAGFDNVDPINHAPAVFRSDWYDYEWPAYPHRHVFMSYGIGDTYTPESAQVALARNLWVDQWQELDGYSVDPLTGVDEIDSVPHSGTKVWFGDDITAVVVLYEPPKNASDEYLYDGHFVMFQNPFAISQLDQFVASYLADGVPTLYAP